MMPTDEALAVFRAIADHIKEPGTFRYLIYDRLGYGPEAYEPVYRAGGMEISNLCVQADSIAEGLGHPSSPHVDALMCARSQLTTLRDHPRDGDERDEALVNIEKIDKALGWLGYKHFTQGGVKWNEKLYSIEAVSEIVTRGSN